jgi:hypothetical protein
VLHRSEAQSSVQPHSKHIELEGSSWWLISVLSDPTQFPTLWGWVEPGEITLFARSELIFTWYQTNIAQTQFPEAKHSVSHGLGALFLQFSGNSTHCFSGRAWLTSTFHYPSSLLPGEQGNRERVTNGERG